MKPLLIIAAMPIETSLLETTLMQPHKQRCAGFDVVEGMLDTLRVIVCAAGVGKINAAAAAAVMIERYRPRLVINVGCAGAYIGSGLSVGNLTVASDEVLADDGVIVSDGWKDLRSMDLPSFERGGRRHFNSIPLSRHASEKAMQLADYYGVFLMRGRFATVSTCSGTRERGMELSRRWNAIVENMEGAAIALVCLRFGVDCLEIRGISNMVDERDMGKWQIPRAVEAAQRFVLKYLEEMERPDSVPGQRPASVP
ncbi:MAG TPA: futalosine hydrolase [Desulfuromonadales bacterium]|nr:futalosine hydrolase [Desulfuromonadales bacterium]